MSDSNLSVGVHVVLDVAADLVIRLATKAGEEVVDVRVAERVVPIAVPTVPDACARSAAVHPGGGSWRRAGEGCANANGAPSNSIAPTIAPEAIDSHQCAAHGAS